MRPYLPQVKLRAVLPRDLEGRHMGAEGDLLLPRFVVSDYIVALVVLFARRLKHIEVVGVTASLSMLLGCIVNRGLQFFRR